MPTYTANVVRSSEGKGIALTLPCGHTVVTTLSLHAVTPMVPAVLPLNQADAPIGQSAGTAKSAPGGMPRAQHHG